MKIASDDRRKKRFKMLRLRRFWPTLACTIPDRMLSCQPQHAFAAPVTSLLLSLYSFRGWGVWGHHLPLLFSGLVQLPLIVTRKMRCRGCRVAAAATAIPVLTSGQFWPSPLPDACTTGTSTGLVGGQACLWFPSRRPWFLSGFVLGWSSLYIEERRIYVKCGMRV